MSPAEVFCEVCGRELEFYEGRWIHIPIRMTTPPFRFISGRIVPHEPIPSGGAG